MSSEVSVALGLAVKELREKVGLSQEQLGLETGVHRTYVSLIERGIRHPTVDILFRLAGGLRVRPHDLVKVAEKNMAAR